MGRRLTLKHGATAVAYDQDVIRIGRDPACDFVLNDPSVSMGHATLRRIGGEWAVYPEESTNGTRRRGDWVLPGRWSLVASGDDLLFGAAEVQVTIPGQAELGAKLIGLEGLASMRAIELIDKPGGMLIGRAEDADIRLDTAKCSRRHARLSLVDGSWWIADEASTSGVFVNELRVTDRRLAHGDEVRIGSDVLAYVHHQRSDVAFGNTDERPADVPAGPGETVEQPALGDRETMILKR
jgi:pSer/pThr/pTyr-binding forkhead associated (FHA) protein